MGFDLEKHTIFKAVAGSRAYGTNTPESDYDYRCICIPPADYWLGAFFNFDQTVSVPDPNDPEKEDSVVYNIKKFFKLAADGNPNILELLWMPDDCVIKMTHWMEKIIEHRDKFLSLRIKHTYSGYAMSQLKRIKSHKAWLLNPPKKQPIRADFGLPDNQDLDKFKKQVLKLNQAGYDAMSVLGEQIQAEAAYKTAQSNWKSYQNWKKNRNPKRAALEAKFGYDTKHAMHLIRLMRQGYEIITTGEVIVRRPDAEELLAIRNEGIWGYDELIQFATDMDQKLTDMYNSNKSNLPKKPDIKFLNDLQVSIVSDHLKFL